MWVTPFIRAGIMFLVLGSTAVALEPGLPSKTAVYVAAARALGSKNPDPRLRNPDDLAIKFIGPRERAILPDYPMDALDLLHHISRVERTPARFADTRAGILSGDLIDGDVAFHRFDERIEKAGQARLMAG